MLCVVMRQRPVKNGDPQSNKQVHKSIVICVCGLCVRLCWLFDRSAVLVLNTYLHESVRCVSAVLL